MKSGKTRKQDGGALLLGLAGLVVVAGVTSAALSLNVEQSERGRDAVNATRGVMATDSYRRMVIAGYDPDVASAWVGDTLYSDLALNGSVNAGSDAQQGSFSAGLSEGQRSWGYAFSFSNEINDVSDFDGAEIESVSLPPDCAQVTDETGEWLECRWSGHESDDWYADGDWDEDEDEDEDCWPGNGKAKGRTGCHPTGAYASNGQNDRDDDEDEDERDDEDDRDDEDRYASRCAESGLIQNWLPKGLRDRKRIYGAWADAHGLAPEYCANWKEDFEDRPAHLSVTYTGYMRFPANTRFVLEDGAEVEFQGPVVFEGDLVVKRGDARGGDLTFEDRVLLPDGTLDLSSFLADANGDLARFGSLEFEGPTFASGGVLAGTLTAPADITLGPVGSRKDATVSGRFLAGCFELEEGGAMLVNTSACRGDDLDLGDFDVPTPEDAAIAKLPLLFQGPDAAAFSNLSASHSLTVVHCENRKIKDGGKKQDAHCETTGKGKNGVIAIRSSFTQALPYLEGVLNPGASLQAVDALDENASPTASELAAGRYGYEGWQML